MRYRWFTFQLVAVCVLVFILQNIFPSITDEFALNSAQVLSQPWTLITYIFLHASIEHIFYNMFALAVFGSILEKLIGTRKFLLVFFASGIVAGIGSVLFYSSSIGASGAIYGVMGALAVLRPWMIVYIYVPLPMFLAVAFWSAGDLLGFFTPGGTVAYAAHLFGLALGISYGIGLRKEFGANAPRKQKEDISDKELDDWEDRYMRK